MGNLNQVEFFDCRAAAELLTYDLMRAVRTFHLDAARLARVLNTDAAHVEDILSGRGLIIPSSPEGQRGVRLVRLHRALGDAFGSLDAVERFMTVPDREDGAVPAELLEEPDGIERVFARLDCESADQWRPRSTTNAPIAATG